ncbi:UNVERIFIED_CONTAM: hypothetical protein Slati_2879000 [Sesamum latifolium]|uniref:Uncharacterized protein n=1 Tax=Sesamum latifolium TaxID=2727402 RepID=A0AAW2VCZ2_9LAMI
MPKERRERSLSLDRSRLSPFPCSSSYPRQSLTKNPLEDDKNVKEWEAARCPVCMEHPHNAILLICSSHEKGCRPFMCDTSYRHSNCFDQFRKSFSDASAELQSPKTCQSWHRLCRLPQLFQRKQFLTWKAKEVWKNQCPLLYLLRTQ